MKKTKKLLPGKRAKATRKPLSGKRVAMRKKPLLKAQAPEVVTVEELQAVIPPAVVAREEPGRVAGERVENSALTLYLREIGETKLLTPAEEIVLAKRIQKGDKAAREHMIKANLRLVVKIARDYEGLGLPLLDFIN